MLSVFFSETHVLFPKFLLTALHHDQEAVSRCVGKNVTLFVFISTTMHMPLPLYNVPAPSLHLLVAGIVQEQRAG